MLNCAAFVAGIIEGVCSGVGVRGGVSAHNAGDGGEGGEGGGDVGGEDGVFDSV